MAAAVKFFNVLTTSQCHLKSINKLATVPNTLVNVIESMRSEKWTEGSEKKEAESIILSLKIVLAAMFPLFDFFFVRLIFFFLFFVERQNFYIESDNILCSP